MDERGSMVLDRLENAERYFPLHPLLRAGFDFLRTDLAGRPLGRNEIDGERVYALISRGPGKGPGGALLEFHRKYIDIQYVIAGSDRIGWMPAAKCRQVSQAYDAQADVGFFSDPAETWLTVCQGEFAIFFPDDAHAPLATAEAIHKVIVKLAVEA